LTRAVYWFRDVFRFFLVAVKGDKLREVKAGCDGTWVAHPGYVSADPSYYSRACVTLINCCATVPLLSV
jgi:malate synthase